MLTNSSGSTTCFSASRTTSSATGIPLSQKRFSLSPGERAGVRPLSFLNLNEHAVIVDPHFMGDRGFRGRHGQGLAVANVELRPVAGAGDLEEIGRASCRERV